MDEPKKTVEEILASIPPAAFTQQGKFAPKFNFAQRCEIFAWNLHGISRKNLARAFGIDRRTASQICNPNAPVYKNVHEEFLRLGKEAFINKYVTEMGSEKIREAIINRPTGPSQYANRRRGVNMAKNAYCKYEHRINVEWLPNGEQGTGWYFQDLDGAFPEAWLTEGEESRVSSDACLRAAKEVIIDA